MSAARSRPPMGGRSSGATSAVVVSVGGSLLSSEADTAPYVAELADLLRSLGRAVPLVVTTGGGRTAREYIGLGSRLGLTPVELDELGIDVTRLHARLLAGRIGLPTPSEPPATVRQAVEALRHASPIVLGGTEPGHTTDAVAAIAAVRLRAARLVNATDVDGVYDADPKRSPGARRFDRLSWPAFLELLRTGTAGGPGQNFPFDRPGAEALARAGIPLSVVAGNDLANLRRAIEGAPCVGTVVGATGGGGP